MTEKVKTKVVNTYLEIKEATITVVRNLYLLIGGLSVFGIGLYAIFQGKDRLTEVLGGTGLIFAGAFAVVVGIALLAQLLTKRS